MIKPCKRELWPNPGFLRWAGSKRQLLPILKDFWNEHFDRYVEPFAGSACLFFELAPRRALLGDLNKQLIGLYRELKARPESVIDSLNLLKRGGRTREAYLAIRKDWGNETCKATQAARFIYLNRLCFNGLFRTNQLGKFNVPYGGEKAGRLPPSQVLRDCSSKLKNTTLVSGDFERVLHKVQVGDFVYMDPPFSVRERRTFREYHADSFSDADIKRLRAWLENLADKKIQFLVSYAECDESKLLSRGFKTVTVSVRRNIAGFTGARARSREVLIYRG